MLKPLLVLAVVANTFFISPSEGSEGSSYDSVESVSSSSYAESSSYSSSSSSSSYSSSETSVGSGKDDCSDGNPPKPPKCPKNEVFDPCPVLCPPRECGVNPAVMLCAVPPKPGDKDCKPGCRCRDGYLRNYDGVCIPKDKCPRCPRNEVYDECPAPCPPQRCDVDPRVIRCAAPPKPGDPKCEPGCRCLDNYARTNEGVCVPRDKCPKCTKPHEVWDPCPPNCPPQTCESLYEKYHCPRQLTKGSKDCKGSCRCEPGYYRNKIGECISEENCRKCCGPNEYFSCGGACDNVCATLSEQNQTCCPIVNVVCNPMCYCESNYARDDKNICIPIEECPVPQCGKHEILSKCPQYECRPMKCSEVGFPVPCPATDDSSCPGPPACVCERGYVKDDEGICIPIGDCPSCGGDANAVSGCGVNCGKHCSDYKKKDIACILVCYENACDCRDGFVLDDNTKKCVRPEDCTPTCGANEVYSNCSNGGCGPKECSGLGHRIGCVKMDLKYCKGGCICKEGYLRDDNGKCIPKKECPTCGGDPNAVSGCGTNCNRRCSDYNKKPQVCTEECKEDGCDCRKGYVLDENTGLCVRPKDCTPVCGKNEVFSTCVNGGCSPKKCSQLGKPVPCVKPKKCISGCLCKEGWLRAENGKCVPKEKCPQPECGKNERFEQCPDTLCTPQNCSQLGFPWPAVPCPPPGDGPCPGPPGCVCIDDYVRDDEGNCIPKKECPSCGGDPNAVSGCGVNCGKLCSNYDKGAARCPKICYPNACDCRDGFVLDENIKKCVRPEDCTPICGINEFYDPCGNSGCRRWNCSQPTLCIDTTGCEGRCVCLEDYARADNGTCIPVDQCEQCNKPHEYWDSCAPMCPPQTCESIDRKYKCPAQPLYCRGACRCEKGYYRNKIGDCISKKDCKKCTGPHEYFSCGGACDNVCATLHKQNQTNCPIINIKCNPKCYCEEGYARDENNICIPIDKCPPPECPDGERYEDCPDNLCTPQTCDQLGFPIKCPALSGNPSSGCPGRPGCVCDNGNVRDKDGNCIPKEECPSCGGDPNAVSGCGINCGRHCHNYKKKNVVCPLLCKLNSCDCRKGYVYDDNLKKCVRPKDCTPTCGLNEVWDTCANGGCRKRKCSQPEICVRVKECEGGCICRDGYTRADNGTCIPIDQCPGQCNKPHEYYDECAPSCPPQTCESIGKKYNCPIQPAVCKGACRCEKGYYRNKIGECISGKDCKKCTGPHEYFSCGGACDNVCATINKQNQTSCPIINIDCNRKCYCEKDYARDENNICIPIDECPPPQCADDERYEECPDNLCYPTTCSQLGFPINCTDISGNPNAPCPGDPGCVCDYGNVRDDDGNCIPKEQCPSCGGDPNAVSGCGSNCGRRCSNYKEKNVVCPLSCMLNGCDCRQDYVYDDNLNKCVLPEDCTPTCRKNEVYDTCANGGCRRRECSQGIICVRPRKCRGGCICREGYTRNDKGICIPEEQCPEQCGPNERYEKCPERLCSPQKCSQLGFPIDCPAIADDDSSRCSPGCICDYGYVRDDDGKCIPEKECPSCGGDPHAEAGCGLNCGRLCSNYDQGPVPCPKICKVNACDCRKGYVLDENIKKCVRPKKCTPICGEDEVFSECINGGCLPKNCSQLGKPVPCVKIDPKYCIKGCLCKEKYLRTDEGKCVPEDECPLKCDKPNEYYDKCPPRCPPQTCESIGKNYFCPKQTKDCKPACRCKKGYYRNKIGECITKKECLQCTGDHEYFSCGGACDNVCDTLHEQNQTNCPIYTYTCNRMCYCEEGYARDDNNVCIPIDKCPEPKCCEGQRFVKCPPALCAPLTCSQVGYPVACPDLPPDGKCPAKPACVCNDENVKDKDGNCIPMKECPSCGGDPNAVSGCGNHCGNTCADYRKKNVACTAECYYNACDCKKGYVYDEQVNKCVRPKDCSPTCGKNEVFDTCANGGCTKRNCTQLGQPTLCIDPIKCKGGCVCARGYLRTKDGVCVPEEQCPAACKKPHEVYDPCPPICPPQTCESLDRAYACPMIPADGNQYCNSGCRCEDGYYRNKIGECISEKDCLKCMGPNEYFSCGSACDNVCAKLDKQNKTHCPIINKKCNPKCYCVDGYARDQNNICIPIGQCSLSCNGDPNGFEGCGINCGRHCYDLPNGPSGYCPDVCQLYGCDCKDNYFYDDNIGKCVLPKDCTPTCGENEVFNDCINGGCQKKNCSQLGKPDKCVRPRECIKGCLCIEGYLRHDNGTCVPVDQCEETCNGDPNAEPGCGMNCGRLCSNYNQEPKMPCAPICQEGACNCKPDYVFDNNIGKCVLPEDCTPVCKINEEYDACSNGGCEIRKCSELVNPITCEDPLECIGDCVCKQGFLRDENGVCVPIRECKPTCGAHEVFDPCPPNCSPNTCESIGKAYSCPANIYKNCVPGCVCEPGYYRNKIDECISKKDCLKCTGPNEYFSCGGACDDVCATLNEQNKTHCPIINIKCNPRCYCVDGFARDAKNICVPVEDCPRK